MPRVLFRAAGARRLALLVLLFTVITPPVRSWVPEAAAGPLPSPRASPRAGAWHLASHGELLRAAAVSTEPLLRSPRSGGAPTPFGFTATGLASESPRAQRPEEAANIIMAQALRISEEAGGEALFSTKSPQARPPRASLPVLP